MRGFLQKWRSRFAEIAEEIEPLRKLWNSLFVGVPLWIAFACLAVYWIFRVPAPGYAIGALATVAGIMSVREMKTLGKVSWVVLLVCLLITEFRAIDKDRAENDARQKEFFEAQRNGFQEITDQASSNFSKTAQGLESAITGIDSALKITNKTMQQTHPHAFLQYQNIDSLLPGQPLPMPIVAGAAYRMNVWYVNAGAEPATVYDICGTTYVAKIDDRNDQKKISAQFDRECSGKPTMPPSNAEPGLPHFSTFQTRALSNVDVELLTSRKATIYYLLRFAYKDNEGKWFRILVLPFRNPDNT